MVGRPPLAGRVGPGGAVGACVGRNCVGGNVSVMTVDTSDGPFTTLPSPSSPAPCRPPLRVPLDASFPGDGDGTCSTNSRVCTARVPAGAIGATAAAAAAPLPTSRLRAQPSAASPSLPPRAPRANAANAPA